MGNNKGNPNSHKVLEAHLENNKSISRDSQNSNQETQLVNCSRPRLYDL